MTLKGLFDTIVAAGLAFEAKLLAQPAARQYDAPTLPETELTPPPDDMGWGFRRGMKPITASDIKEVHAIPLNEARAMMRDTVRHFLQTYQPNTLLLVKPKPGVGKTTMAVALAEDLARQGKRVLFCGPRHNFFHDIQIISMDQNEGVAAPWYEWLGRNHVDDTGTHDMCIYPEDINKWMGKGYEGKDFCSGVCGWKYMAKSCPYHQQKHKAGRLVFGQHAHLWTGLPAGDHGEFDVIICDESPMGQMLHKWIIPAKYVVPSGMDVEDPLTELIFDLARLVDGKQVYEGEALFRALGGVTHVREILEAWDLDIGDAKLQAPRIRQAGDAEVAPYGHLVQLIPMMLREARLLEAGTPGIARVVVANGNLMLLKRRATNPKYADLPMIWLDGTAERHICEAISRREVVVVEPVVKMKGTIYQVTDRANGKSSLVDDRDGYTNKTGQLTDQIGHVVKTRGYKNVGVITYQAVKDLFGKESVVGAGHMVGHFYGARGTNEFEDCDAIFVAGTPQPQMGEILTMAKMIYYERDEPFDKTWSAKDIAYVGQPWAYPIGGFWGDADLQAVLRQIREAEIEQAAHRGRPISRACDIWLMTNMPVDGLPPDQLIKIMDLFEAPRGVDAYAWAKLMDLVAMLDAKGIITTNDVVEHVHVSRPTATRMIDQLCDYSKEHDDPEDRWEPVHAAQKRGRPIKAAARSSAR